MGNCLGQDVKSQYKAGGLSEQPSTGLSTRGQTEAQHAVALLTGSMAYSTWMELQVQCRNLKDADILSKTDAMCILYEQRNGTWHEIGRTEFIANTLNPSFIKRFRVLYCFEKVQQFRLLAVDIDKGDVPEKVDPASCGFLGSAEFTIGEVVTAKDKTLTRTMTNKDGRASHSTLVVVGEESSNCKLVYRIQLKAHGLRNIEMIGKSDPFLQISRLQEDGKTWLPVYKTETKHDNLSPTWDMIHIRSTQLNNGDSYRPLKLEVFDYENSGRHRLLGWCEMSADKMQRLSGQAGERLQPPLGKSAGTDAGTLQVRLWKLAGWKLRLGPMPLMPSSRTRLVLSFATEPQPSFLEYIQGGTEISFIVGIDFTGSNGDPRTPGTKHYFGGGQPTQYERAVMGVGQVLEYYDADRMYPTFGFGGTFGGSPANHCFPLDSGRTECAGVQGILQAYRHAIQTWQLSGPTLFAPLIRMASNIASSTVGSYPPKYTVLLILTDGAIMDMAETVDAVIQASSLPISILIVGIGNDDFGKMETLDSDKKRLSANGRTAERDIVQFVEFNKLASSDGARLAEELLAELPGQLLAYMRLKNIPCPQALPAPPPALVGYPGPPGAPSSGAPSAAPSAAGSYYPGPSAAPSPPGSQYPQYPTASAPPPYPPPAAP